VAAQLGDRVRRFFTINEFASFVEGGYQGLDVQVGGGQTVHLGAAPGLRLPDGELNQVRHHAVLGHGLAVQAIRARGQAGTRVGFAENMRAAVPVIDAPAYVTAALARTRVASKNNSCPRTSPAAWHSSTTCSKKRRKTATPRCCRILVRVEWSGRGSSRA